MKSSTLPLPDNVRAAVEEALGGKPIREEFAWMSWAGTVWRLVGDGGISIFVKRAKDLTGERDRLAWLRGRWPVPELVGFFHELGDDWLLTHEIAGLRMSHASAGWPAERVALTLGEILRGLHATDAADCPFGTRRAGHVLIHGDYCLPNVLVSDGKLSGLVDVGLSGLGNPEVDLAAGVWTLQYNYGKGFARPFLDAYGWPPMTDAAIEKLRRKYGR
ncbi:MAG TPA: phosphotransferase [Candidatus Dormibacteraeota bacterium]|nr:phosphotransferase [Candidatus Dormibacteraeota bacterium]